MKKYILLGAILAVGLVQADVAPVVNQAKIAGGGDADTNFSPTGGFDIKEGGGVFTRYAVMKVDLSGIGPGETVTAATFTMKVKNNNNAVPGNFQLFGVIDSAANGWDWNTDMTWNEAAAQGMWTATEDLNTQGLLDAKLVDLGSTAFTGTGTPYEYFPTSTGVNLVNLMNSDTDNMLTIFAAYDINANVGVREMLTTASIDYTSVIPEPGTLGLIACASVGLIGIRRFFLI